LRGQLSADENAEQRTRGTNMKNEMQVMNSQSIPWWVWLIPAVLMAIATARLPYGYYTFLRIVTCGAGILFAFAAWNRGQTGQILAIVTVLLAILFNPILPVHLARTIWFKLNLLGAAVFTIDAAFMWKKRHGSQGVSYPREGSHRT
jgi:FtsH-binding integral membrane protein